jgi:hypothetical protein
LKTFEKINTVLNGVTVLFQAAKNITKLLASNKMEKGRNNSPEIKKVPFSKF